MTVSLVHPRVSNFLCMWLFSVFHFVLPPFFVCFFSDSSLNHRVCFLLDNLLYAFMSWHLLYVSLSVTMSWHLSYSCLSVITSWHLCRLWFISHPDIIGMFSYHWHILILLLCTFISHPCIFCILLYHVLTIFLCAFISCLHWWAVHPLFAYWSSLRWELWILFIFLVAWC